MNIGKAVTELRKMRELTQKRLAEESHISESALSAIETGKSWPHWNTIDAISHGLGVPVAMLLFYALESTDLPESWSNTYATLNEPLKAALAGKLL